MTITPLRILLVEDNPIDGDLLQKALPGERIGPYEFVWAQSVADALQVLAKHETDVVLLDLALPDSKGLETLTKVHSQACWVPIIVLTASDDDKLALQALQQGAQDYLTKGYIQVYRNLLGRTMRHAIERHRMTTELNAAREMERQRAEELQRAYQDLKVTQQMLIQAEKMAAVGQLASGIAHEVKNPLTIILQGIDFLEREVTTDRGSQPYEITQMMREAVMRSDRIIRGLLDFSRPTQLELQPLDLAPLVEASLRLVDKQLAVENIQVVQQLAQDLPKVMLDANQMKQVFINLILNAFQAMQPQGGQLTVKTEVRTLNVLGHRVGNRSSDFFRLGDQAVICAIRDTGKGIPQAVLSRIFDPFFTTKPPGEGTGLGLAITRAIVEEHRGFLVVASTEGQGTTLTLTLPIAVINGRAINGKGR